MNKVLKIILIMIGILIILGVIVNIISSTKIKNTDKEVVEKLVTSGKIIKKISASDLLLNKNDLDELWQVKMDGEYFEIGEIEKWPLVGGVKEYLHRQITWSSSRTNPGQQRTLEVSVMEAYSEEVAGEWYNITKKENNRSDNPSYPNYSLVDINVGDESFAGGWLTTYSDVHELKYLEHQTEITFRKENFIIYLFYSSLNINEDYNKVAIDLANKIVTKFEN